jgi:hypothetical protein
MATPGAQLTSTRKEVMADKLLDTHSKKYVEDKKRKLLEVRIRGDKVIISGDNRTVRNVKSNTEVLEYLKNIIAAEEDDEDEVEEAFKYVSDEGIEIPPLFCQVGDKAKGWNAKNVEKQTTLYLNLLGAGKGGKLNMTNKTDNTAKPPWFNTKVNWNKYVTPCHASMEDNLAIIKGIFLYFNLDLKVHCMHPPEVEEEIELELELEVPEVREEPGEPPLHEEPAESEEGSGELLGQQEAQPRSEEPRAEGADDLDMEEMDMDMEVADLMDDSEEDSAETAVARDEDTATGPPAMAYCGVAGCAMALNSWSEIKQHMQAVHGDKCLSSIEAAEEESKAAEEEAGEEGMDNLPDPEDTSEALSQNNGFNLFAKRNTVHAGRKPKKSMVAKLQKENEKNAKTNEKTRKSKRARQPNSKFIDGISDDESDQETIGEKKRKV